MLFYGFVSSACGTDVDDWHIDLGLLKPKASASPDLAIVTVKKADAIGREITNYDYLPWSPGKRASYA